MKLNFIWAIALTLMLWFTGWVGAVSAQTTTQLSAPASTKCEQYQEAFSFQVPTYAIDHQNGAVLNLNVAYRFTSDAIAQNNYPDFVQIRKEIDHFLVNYPNETDYWEIMNKKLVKHLLDQYPQISSLSLKIEVTPTPQEPFARSSWIRSTRAQGCPLMDS